MTTITLSPDQARLCRHFAEKAAQDMRDAIFEAIAAAPQPPFGIAPATWYASRAGSVPLPAIGIGRTSAATAKDERG